MVKTSCISIHFPSASALNVIGTPMQLTLLVRAVLLVKGPLQFVMKAPD